MGRLEGKIVVVTGGSSGIGLATAQRFVQEGASVFITGRGQVELDLALAAIGGDITAIRADSTVLCTNLDSGIQGKWHSRQHVEPWSHRHSDH